LCGLLAPTQVGGPGLCGLRLGEFMVQCGCLEPTSIGENGVGPSGDAANGGPGGLTMADQPDFESASDPSWLGGRGVNLWILHRLTGWQELCGAATVLRSVQKRSPVRSRHCPAAVIPARSFA
jgi:hypothetical protein